MGQPVAIKADLIGNIMVGFGITPHIIVKQLSNTAGDMLQIIKCLYVKY